MPIAFFVFVLCFRSKSASQPKLCIRLSDGINSFNGRFSKSLPNGNGKIIFDYDLATLDGPFNSGSLHGKTKMTDKKGRVQFSGNIFILNVMTRFDEKHY